MEIVIFTGNIGSGKSLLASKYAKKGYVIINNDDITRMVQGGEYGAYDFQKRTIYKAIEFAGIEEALNCGLSVVIDRTNMKKSDRARYIEVGKKYGAKIISRDFGIGSIDTTLTRRFKDHKGVPNEVWCSVFAKMASSYEAPHHDEGFDEIVIAPKRYTVHAFDFDGKIVINKYPIIGDIIPDTIAKMNEIWNKEDNIIIIWTCRADNDLRLMKKFLLDNKVPFDFINENPLFETGSRKIFAHYYYETIGMRQEDNHGYHDNLDLEVEGGAG